MYDPVLRRSICAKQEEHCTILSCHKEQCLGPNVCSCFKAMDRFKQCGTVAGTKSMPIQGDFLAIISTETSILEVSNSESTGLNTRYFTPGEHFFYIKDWCLTVVPVDCESTIRGCKASQASNGVNSANMSIINGTSINASSPEITKRIKPNRDMPENLENAGIQWLHGRDSAEVTDYILDHMFHNSNRGVAGTDTGMKHHGVSILRAGNVSTSKNVSSYFNLYNY